MAFLPRFFLSFGVFFFIGCETTPDALPFENKVCIEFDAPNPGWILGIQEVWEKEGVLHVYAELRERNPGQYRTQVITPIGSCAPVPRDGKPIRVYVAGKTWNWTSDEAIVEVPGVEAYRSLVGTAQARRRFPR